MHTQKLKSLNVRLKSDLLMSLEVVRHRRTLAAGSRVSLQEIVAEAVEKFVAANVPADPQEAR